MSRRGFISSAGLALAASFAGCLSAINSTDPPQGTEDLPVRFWLEEVSLSTSEQESSSPIVFGELSEGEQEIVGTALEAGAYTVDQGLVSPAFESLRERIERRTGNGKTLEAYLSRRDVFYRIGFSDGDHIIAHPDL